MELSAHMRAGVPSIRAAKGTIETCAHWIPAIRQAIRSFNPHERGNPMSNIVYIVGLIVIVVAILSFFGLR